MFGLARRFKSLLEGVSLALEGFSLALNRALSWSGWTPILLLGSLFGIYVRQSDLVMLILTIQTSLDAAATKTLQHHVREAEEVKERAEAEKAALLRQQVDDSAALIVEIRRQNDLIIEMMEDSRRRDMLASKRDRMILGALKALSHFVEFAGKEVPSRHVQGKTRAPASRKRTAHGRANRKKP